MAFELNDPIGHSPEEAATQFETMGYVILEGVEQALTRRFRSIVAERLQLSEDAFEAMLNPDGHPVEAPLDVRDRLACITTSSALADQILGPLQPLLLRLLGPLVHVSSSFRGHFHEGDVPPVAHGEDGEDHPEPRPHLVHQNFSSATIPTSPGGVTLWVGLNTTPDWTLRLYPGSHRYGLLCRQGIQPDDPRLAPFGEPIEIPAQAGRVVVFNSLLLHSTNSQGPHRCVSCAIRFFPLCGFLSSLPHCLDRAPAQRLLQGIAGAEGPTLRAPVLETLAYLGALLPDEEVLPHSMMNWAHYVARLVAGDPAGALPWLERFVNTDVGLDPASAYVSTLHDRTIHPDPIRVATSHLELGHDLTKSAERVHTSLLSRV